MKSPHMHTGLAATLPWLVHHYVPTIHLPSTSSNTPHCTRTCTPMHPLRARLHCHIWTCLSNHVSHCLEEFSPQTSPSGISYPMVGVPSMCPPPPINLWQYSTLHPHLHTCSEPGCTATFGCAHPSMFPIAWRTSHHKPALVAPIILWLEYPLCAHHTNFPNFQAPGTH